MPALKMKTKSATFSSREKNLHVSQKSSVISKNSLYLAKNVQYMEEVAGSLEIHHDVPLCNKVLSHGVGRNGANANELLDEPLEKKQTLVTDSATVYRMDSAALTCPSNSETIFSPVMEYADACSESNVPSVGGRNNLYVPHLETEDSDSSGSSSDYQMCNVSDFYISDMIVSCLPIEGEPLDDDSLTARFLSDNKCEKPDTFTNTDEEFLLFPFLKEIAAADNGEDCRTAAETVIQSDDLSLYMAIRQLTSSEGSDAITYSEADRADSFDPLIFIRNLPEISERPTMVPKESHRNKSITLVLDLDETLVHSTLEHCDDADFTFPVFLNMKEHTVYVKQRPHLKTFLERVAEMFEIVIFTASQSIYASKLLDILDPDGKLISKRAYRESCIFSDGSYTKDLTVLGVDLAKVVIIDNTPQVFRLQVNNGIPIKSWFDDPSDTALVSLLTFLEMLADVDDVRPIIAKKFGNKEHESLVSS